MIIRIYPQKNLAVSLKIITFGGVVDCYLLWRVEPDAPAIQEQEKVYTILIPKDTFLFIISFSSLNSDLLIKSTPNDKTNLAYSIFLILIKIVEYQIDD